MFVHGVSLLSRQAQTDTVKMLYKKNGLSLIEYGLLYTLEDFELHLVD